MAIISLVGALATQDRTFLIYAVYALSKIVSWCTILGYTHQFFIKEGFHWNYLSVSGAFGVLAGTVFARAFLQTQKYTPRIDYVLIFMMLNADLNLLKKKILFLKLVQKNNQVVLILKKNLNIFCHL